MNMNKVKKKVENSLKFQALMAVGDILCHYDSDGNYPVYGFGGKVPWLNNQVSHCFPLKYEFFYISTKKNMFKFILKKKQKPDKFIF